MPIKQTGPGTDAREIDRWDGGVGWIAYPEEKMLRTSHALLIGGDVWVVEPVDYPGLDELLANLGEVKGVAVLLDRHTRDAAAIARRHDVAVHVPTWMDGITGDLDAPVERLPTALGDYRVQKLVDNQLWQEAMLYDGETLYVPEALGTAGFFRASGERIGVHPLLRLTPPRDLLDLDVERLLVGHGEGVFVDPGNAITEAVDGARKRAPAVYARALKEFVTD